MLSVLRKDFERK